MTRAHLASIAVTAAVLVILLTIGTDTIAPLMAHLSTTIYLTAQ